MHGIRLWLATACLVGAACGVSKSGLDRAATDDGAVADGIAATGGRVGSGGTAGSGGVAAGGTTGSGGVTRTGGATGSGGVTRTGGTTGSGGIGQTGGTTGSGGVPRTGGRTGAGGTTGMGGTTGARDASADGTSLGTGGGRGDATGSADGPPTALYVGCSYIGGIDRAVIARQDYETGMCTNVLLESPSRSRDAGYELTVSGNWAVAAINLWPMGQTGCASRATMPTAAHPISGSGSITIDHTAWTISADVSLVFALDAGGTATVVLDADGVSLQGNCDI